MGGRLSTIEHKDSPGPSVNVELFRTIRPKWVEYFITKLNESILSDLDIANKDEMVQWRYYFKAFSEIKTFAERDAEVKKRLTWHPATAGFLMQIEVPIEEEEDPPKGLPDDFTEDEASDISESDNYSEDGTVDGKAEEDKGGSGDGETENGDSSKTEEKSSVAPFVPPKHWNPQHISPIFYGYGTMTVNEYRQTMDETHVMTEKSERRAVEKAMSSRLAALEEFEANIKAKEAVRVKKLEEITAAYDQERKRREDDLARNKKSLPEMGFKIYKAKWDKDYSAAEKAYDTEVLALRRVHLAKTQEDQTILRAKREDVESFKDAENQELPAAERLEEISKAEMALWIDEVEIRAMALEAARSEYQKLRIEFSNVQNNKRKAMEMKSALNITETKVRTMQRRLEEGLASLTDAETLLDRSVRIKDQQDKLLPLFQLVSQLPRGAKECRLDILLACIVILCSGTFDQKLTQVIQAYDADHTGQFGFKFLVRIQMVFHEALFRMKYLPFPPIETEVNHFTERYLLERGLSDISRVKINQYELKQFMAACVGCNKTLCSLLGVAHKVPYGTYQRNTMTEVALNERGLISKSTLMYRYHFNVTRYRPLLEPEHVSNIHDLALSMGANDPLKTDYTKFTRKTKRASDSAVVPLDTGHLTNLKYYCDTIKNDCALAIQTCARAYIQRRHAEFQAKRQAFTQAKLLAMQEMKEKVLKEFKKREGLEGPPKMKWDAQVRMRQAKLRQAGTNLSRADVVMVMMEEAIVRSREEIESRFRKLEKEQGIDPEVDPDDVQLEQEPEDGSQGMFSVFGLMKKKANTDVMQEEGEDIGELGTPRAEDDDEEATAAERTATEMERDQSEAERGLLMVLGKYQLDPSAAGETFNETMLRMTMASPEAPYQHLWARLKTVDKNLTDVKLKEFLSEFPSKRLLMLYLGQLTAQQLEVELRDHFKIARHWDTIAETLKFIEASDLENGWHKQFLSRYKEMSEGGLRSLVLEDVERGVNEVETMVEKRFNGSEGRIPEVDIIKGELDRICTHLQRFKGASNDILASIQQLKFKYRKVMLSVGEMERREFNVRSVYNKLVNIAQARVPVSSQHRHNWMKRVNVALRRNVETLADAELKFGEIRCVCKEFLEYATHDAIVIIQEHFQPKEFRSTPISSERAVRGRPSVCGRGVDGIEYVYENHNIQYRVCLDYDGAFDGSDEFAAKCGGFDRLGSVEYFKCHTNKLNIPIVATIDYFGFRIIAVSKLPTETVMFTDEGEVKRVKEELYHGMKDNGDRFVNRSKTLQNLLRQTADKLNLCEHGAKGIEDMAGSLTHCSSEIKVFKSTDDEFYLKDFWRSFPSEAPEETPHFQETPRGQTVFWRQLRPEYVRRYAEPLSPDAMIATAYNQVDQDEQYNRVRHATKHLMESIIPVYAETLCNREYTQTIGDGLGVDLTTELHDQGISIRHLGFIRGLMWRQLPGTFNIFFNEKFIRTSTDLRGEVSHGMKIRLAGCVYTVTETGKRRVTETRIPIEKLYTGLSLRYQDAWGGRLKAEKNSEAIRSVILAEMTARTLKNTLRMYLREYTKVEHGISTDVMRSLLCKIMNVITGSDPESNDLLMNAVYEGIRSRFGLTSILPSERDTIQRSLIPCATYIIRRLQKMTGSQLSAQCITEFHEHPEAFHFVPMDFLSIAPIVRHNMPALAFADAMLASMYAAEGEKRTYVAQVLKDKPVLFFLLSERKGTRNAENKGTLGVAFEGKYSPGCEYEQPGPIAQDKFVRSIGFTLGNKSRIETRYHASAVPKNSAAHFTVEAFAMCTGGDSYNRVVCMNGRYGITITRESYWAFIMREEGLHEVSIRVCPVTKDKWTHIVGTYDGTNLRVYVDSWLAVCVEVAGPLRERKDAYYTNYKKKFKELRNLETAERESIKMTAKKQADDYFLTKDGINAMKMAAKDLLYSAEFQAEAFGESAGSREAAMNAKKTEALRRVKHKYATDVYVQAVHQCTERFKELYDDLEVRQKREEEESERNSRKPMRIGASVTTLASKHGKSYFHGRISCVAVYDTCLHLDRIRSHFVAAQKDAAKDAPRLHAVAARLYEQALLFAGDDPMLLRNYAKSLCDYLRVENTSTTEFAIARGKNKIKFAIDDFKNRRLPLGIAEILRAIPVEYRYAELICQGFVAIKEVDTHFFAKSEGLTRKDIVHFPNLFGLNIPDSPEIFTEAAAIIYKEVTKDFECAEIYGDVNMSWISELKSSHLTVALVSQLAEDSDSRSMKISQLFEANPVNIPSLQDSDVQVMCANMRLLVVVDFSRCTQITDIAVAAIATLKSLRALTLDGCALVSDDGLEELKGARESLEVLSLASIATITDEGLAYVGQYCRLLTSINVNNCAQVSAMGLFKVAKGCKRLVTMLASATHIDDDGIAKISASLSKKYFDTMDISFCRDITDHGIVTLVDQCPNMSSLNICGLSSVTDIGTTAICANCWKMAHLNLEDVYLLADRSFFFDRVADGRVAADENMLSSLVTLIVKDCVHISDQALVGLQKRCGKIEVLNLQGCHKLTDKGLAAMYECFDDDGTNSMFPMCDSFRTLVLSSCINLTANGLATLFERCGVLENLDLSGITAVTDSLIADLCRACPTVQRLALRRCVAITDTAICTMASELWLEHLDISYCSKLTDCAIEVLSMACNGLVSLTAVRVRRLTNKAINMLLRNCRLLKKVDLRECESINWKLLDEFSNGYPGVNITHDGNN